MQHLAFGKILIKQKQRLLAFLKVFKISKLSPRVCVSIRRCGSVFVLSKLTFCFLYIYSAFNPKSFKSLKLYQRITLDWIWVLFLFFNSIGFLQRSGICSVWFGFIKLPYQKKSPRNENIWCTVKMHSNITNT